MAGGRRIAESAMAVSVAAFSMVMATGTAVMAMAVSAPPSENR
jgi:hypothetical protein